MTEIYPRIDQARLQEIVKRTQAGKLPWAVTRPETLPRNYALQDTCNVLESNRNGISLRLCQSQKGGSFFLHIMGENNVPVRLGAPQRDLNELLQVIGEVALPRLGKVFAWLNDFTKKPAPTKISIFQKMRNLLPVIPQ